MAWGLTIIILSFGRIHETDLKKKLVTLALTLADPADYDKVNVVGPDAFAPSENLTFVARHVRILQTSLI